MKKIFMMILIFISLFSMSQIQNDTIVNKEINLNDGKYHLLTEEMISFLYKNEKSEIIYKTESSKININLQKIKMIDYHYENDFYYNPIIYKF